MMRDNYELQRQAAARTFLTYDIEKIAQTFGLALDETALYFPILNTPHRLLRGTAQVERMQDGAWTLAGFDAALTVYDLLTNPNGRPVLAHEWCAHTSFHAVQGGTVSGSLMIHPDESARPYEKDLGRLRRACAHLGGIEITDGDFASVLPAFDCLPVLLRFWGADEEFPAQLQLLWDRNTCRYLRYETTFYLSGEILRRLREA